MRLALVVMLVSAPPSFAEERPRVLVSAAGAEAIRGAFSVSLAELLGRLGVDVAQGGEAASDGVFLAVVHVDFADGGGCTVAVDDAEGRLGVKRRLSGSGVVVAETAAHVVQSAVEELVLPQRRARSPSQPAGPSAQTVALAPPSHEPQPSVLEVGVHGGARGLGGVPLPLIAAGVSVVGWGSVLGRRAGGALTLTYLPEIETLRAEISLRVQSLSLRGMAVLQLARSDSWALDVALGGGGDLFLAHTISSLVPLTRVQPLRLDAAPIITAAVEVRLRLTSSAVLAMTASGDFDLSPISYVARLGPSTEVLLSPWTLRPTLTLGVVFTALGAAEAAQ